MGRHYRKNKIAGVDVPIKGNITFYECTNPTIKTMDECFVEYSDCKQIAKVMLLFEKAGISRFRRKDGKITKKVFPEDRKSFEEYQNKVSEAIAFCKTKANEYGLPLKIVTLRYNPKKRIFTVYFVSEKRVDFKRLVKDIAKRYSVRVCMKEIGVRNEAKLQGGIGICGLPLCCMTWLNEFEPISMKYAKNQNLTLNPAKISGYCGRLMCCLKFENDVYKELKRDFPKTGKTVVIDGDRKAKVSEIDCISGVVKLAFQDGTVQSLKLEEFNTRTAKKNGDTK